MYLPRAPQSRRYPRRGGAYYREASVSTVITQVAASMSNTKLAHSSMCTAPAASTQHGPDG